ncbi:MAG: hypothetical protein P8J45_03435 [Phycisphaerales bacterium]|nr:hypothetical protein [Phycisphaerales bacterium]
MNASRPRAAVDPDATPIPPLFILTFLFSVATAVMWNGLGFVAKSSYAFPEWKTSLLFVVNGVIYALGAFGCGRFLRAIAGHSTPRGILLVVLLIQTAAAPLMGIFSGTWAIWTVSIIFSLCSAVLWSTVESYMSAGRHGHSMRTVIGWWNLTWMSSNALGLAAMAFFMADAQGSRWSVAALAPICLLATIMVFWLPRSPAAHDSEKSGIPLRARYRPMLQTSRIMLPMSYVLIGALGPIMPYRLDQLEIGLSWVTPLTATWLVARVGCVLLMSKLHFWHGRWGTLGAAALLMVGGFALVTMGPGVASVLAGLALIGIGQGLTYYSAIYYVLALGNAAVDAAGTHEGLIGVGYAAGPAAVLIGILMGGDSTVAWVVMALVVIVAWPAVSPWWTTRGRLSD